MTRTLLLAAATAGLFFAGLAEASAFQRSGTVTSPRGTGSFAASGSCSNGTCSRSAARTGAYGRSMSHSGSVTKTGNGYSYTGTTTGPNGQTRSRSGNVVVTP